MNPTPEKTEAMQMAEQVQDVAVQIIQSAAGVAHEVYMAALLEAIRAAASAYPCCAEQFGVLLVNNGQEIHQQGRQWAMRADAEQAMHTHANSTIH